MPATSRLLDDWITAYLDYSSHSEAPKRMRFWCAVSAVAGALRHRVWLDMAYFQWTPNFFIILVAPPGIVSKSTTVNVALNLLRQVPEIQFGPDVCTWQSLVKALSENQKQVQLNGDHFLVTSELTLESSELGNLLNPQDREMIDLLITLWDGRKVFNKITKMSGSETIENPWLNIIACTTPSWLAGNFPEHLIGGGFTSRCIFIYAETKEKYIAYPGLQAPKDLGKLQRALTTDLERISLLSGEYRLLPSAADWGTRWYKAHFSKRPAGLDDDRFGGYIARKQTHLHKLAMVLAASRHDELVITVEDLATAEVMLKDVEADMPRVFERFGRGEQSLHVDRLVQFVRGRGLVAYSEVYKFLQSHFPAGKDMEEMLAGLIKSEQLKPETVGGALYLRANVVPTNNANEKPNTPPTSIQ